MCPLPKGHLRRTHFAQIIQEVYGHLCESFSDSDLESGSSGFVEVLIEMGGSFVDAEMLSYKNNSVKHNDIEKLLAKRNVSSTRNEEDVILEVCEESEVVCLFHPKGVGEEFFYFYLRVLDNFKIHFPFTDFEADILTTLNIAPVQLRPNGWGFIKAFEFMCEALNINPTLAIFFSFFELKEADKGN